MSDRETCPPWHTHSAVCRYTLSSVAADVGETCSRVALGRFRRILSSMSKQFRCVSSSLVCYPCPNGVPGVKVQQLHDWYFVAGFKSQVPSCELGKSLAVVPVLR